MMPHRVYGHNYLDKQCLVQVTIGAATSKYSSLPDQPQTAVRLHPRLMGSTSSVAAGLLSSPLLKLVMTSSPAATSAPHSISLPLPEGANVLTFQTPMLEQLSLEFSLYPNFGTKTIGRAVALPSLLNSPENAGSFTLPILDHRLHVIGEVTFDVNIITPFQGVTLEIGGAVETYWKSLGSTSTVPSSAPRRAPPKLQRPRPIASAQASPALSIVTSAAAQAIAVSSITGNYVYLTVQVTHDLHPVVCADWKLPVEEFDLGVADVTLEQFEALAKRTGRGWHGKGPFPSTSPEWYTLLSRSLLSLESLIKILPGSTWLCLELAYTGPGVREQYALRDPPSVDAYVNAILRAVYHASASLDGNLGRRKIIFTSFAPDICASVNWKQPNYPVFFASQCGRTSRKPPSATALDAVVGERDPRLTSLSAAVEFAKNNNLLGVFVDADLLATVPSLVRAVREAGLLIGTYGAAESVAGLSTAMAPGAGTEVVDAVFKDGLLIYHDHSARAWS